MKDWTIQKCLQHGDKGQVRWGSKSPAPFQGNDVQQHCGGHWLSSRVHHSMQNMHQSNNRRKWWETWRTLNRLIDCSLGEPAFAWDLNPILQEGKEHRSLSRQVEPSLLLVVGLPAILLGSWHVCLLLEVVHTLPAHVYFCTRTHFSLFNCIPSVKNLSMWKWV